MLIAKRYLSTLSTLMEDYTMQIMIANTDFVQTMFVLVNHSEQEGYFYFAIVYKHKPVYGIWRIV